MMDVVVPLVIIAVLLLLNGLFVAAEFAIVGAPRASIENQAAKGSVLAKRVRDILEDPKRQDRYIATTQVGISVASLGLGMYGEHVMAEWLAGSLGHWADNPWLTAHAIASVLAIAVLTYFHIVIGEMVPKALALQAADTVVLYVTPPILAVQAALSPVVIALNAIGNAILAMLGVRRQEGGTERYHTSEELQFIIEESAEGGLLRGEAGRILRELFEFGDLTAGEVMVPRVALVGVPVGIDADELRALVRHSPHTRYPVHEGDLDHIVGTLHIRDVLRHLVGSRPVAARDARPVPYVPTSAPLDTVLAAMRRHRAQMAVVMDEHGGTAGLVTIEDLFEEVVGEIEEGRGRTAITHAADGRVRVRGTVRLAEAGEVLDCALEHDSVSSMSGLVLALLGRPPVVGDVVTWQDVRVEVTRVMGRGVAEALLSRVTHPRPQPADDQTPPQTGV